MNFKLLKKKTLTVTQLTDLELILLLRWKPMNSPKGHNLWGLYLGTGRNWPVKAFKCPRTGHLTNIKSSIGKPNQLETQEQFYTYGVRQYLP